MDTYMGTDLLYMKHLLININFFTDGQTRQWNKAGTKENKPGRRSDTGIQDRMGKSSIIEMKNKAQKDH